MNKSVVILTLVVSSCLPIELLEASAFEGAASCSKMAALAEKQAAKLSPQTLRYRFTGFTGYANVENAGSALQEWHCDGYITETSPKGKLVCVGHITLKAESLYLSWGEGTYFQKQLALRRLNRTQSGSALEDSFQGKLDSIEANRLGMNSNCRWK